jgi:hypothetical protein
VPNDDPSPHGLTTTGKPNAPCCSIRSSPLSASTTVAGRGREVVEPEDLLAFALFIASADASTPEPVYGMPSSSSMPWMQPSSP